MLILTKLTLRGGALLQPAQILGMHENVLVLRAIVIDTFDYACRNANSYGVIRDIVVTTAPAPIMQFLPIVTPRHNRCIEADMAIVANPHPCKTINIGELRIKVTENPYAAIVVVMFTPRVMRTLSPISTR